MVTYEHAKSTWEDDNKRRKWQLYASVISRRRRTVLCAKRKGYFQSALSVVYREKTSAPSDSRSCRGRHGPCTSSDDFSARPTVPDADCCTLHSVLQRRAISIQAYLLSIDQYYLLCRRKYRCIAHAARFPFFSPAYAGRHRNAGGHGQLRRHVGE